MAAWIEIDDLLDIYLRAVTDPALAGPVNAVAPGEARNAEYARTLGRVLRRPALIPVPPFGPQLLLGAEGAKELAAASQRVRPAALAAPGTRSGTRTWKAACGTSLAVTPPPRARSRHPSGTQPPPNRAVRGEGGSGQ